MIEVQRVEEKMLRHETFRSYVFSEAEIGYCEKATHKFEHYAARFAAKEAFLKPSEPAGRMELLLMK